MEEIKTDKKELLATLTEQYNSLAFQVGHNSRTIADLEESIAQGIKTVQEISKRARILKEEIDKETASTASEGSLQAVPASDPQVAS
jgi:uncharacterized coiled-coil protein SlyX